MSVEEHASSYRMPINACNGTYREEDASSMSWYGCIGNKPAPALLHDSLAIDNVGCRTNITRMHASDIPFDVTRPGIIGQGVERTSQDVCLTVRKYRSLLL